MCQTLTFTQFTRIMAAIEPRAINGALIGLRDIRKQAGMSRYAFDAMVMAFSREGWLALHRHDYPASLTSVELEQLVKSGDSYFVGCAIREN